MPYYEYECTKCGNHAEVFQKISDQPIKKCELCKGKMKKLISQSTFHLKGSGWYVTDYASKSGGCNAKSGSATEGSKSDTAKEAKVASDSTKKETKAKNAKAAGSGD